MGNNPSRITRHWKSARAAAFRRPLMEFTPRPLAVTRLAAAPSTTTAATRPVLLLPAATAVTVLLAAVTMLAAGALLRVAPVVRVRRALPVAGSEHDFQLVQFVPLGVGALAFRYGQQRLQARAGGIGLRLVHRLHYRIVRRPAPASFGEAQAPGE
jgi:hypothetical protein